MVRTRKQRERQERKKTSARNRADNHRSGFTRTTLKPMDEVNFFSLDKEGIKRIDVISYVAGKGNPYADEGTEHMERTFFVHRGIGPNKDTYVCPTKTVNEKCPVCDYRAKLQKDPKADEDLVKELAPKERQLWNVVDLDNTDRGIQIWDISFHLFGKHVDARIRNSDEDDGYEFYADNEDGLTLRLGIAEKAFAGKKYCEVETIDFKPRKHPYDDVFLEGAYKLDDLLEVLPYDKLKAIFLQVEDGGAEDDETEEEDKKPRKKKLPTAKEFSLEVGDQVTYEDGEWEIAKISRDGTSLTLVNDEDEKQTAVGPEEAEKLASSKDADDWDDEDEDEEPVPKPKKKPRRTKPKPKPKEIDLADDADDDDDDDDDDDWD